MELKSGLRQLFQNKGVDVDETISFLLAIKHNLNVATSEEIYVFLSKNKYIARDYDTGKIVCLIGLYQDEEDNFTLESNLYEEVSSRINEYRQLFKSIRTGAMGSKSQCIEDICRFCVTHNKTFDQVLEVTSYYLQNTQYACNADRFIYHIDSISGKEKSRIETIFEEYENKESIWKTI